MTHPIIYNCEKHLITLPVMDSAVTPSSKRMRWKFPSPVTVYPPSVRLICSDPPLFSHTETLRVFHCAAAVPRQ